MTAYTVKLKRSANAGGIPTTSDLALGELAVNTTDGKLFTKKSVNGTESIVTLGGSVWDASGTNIFATGKDLGLGVTSPLSVFHIKDDAARILFHNDNTGANATDGLLLGLGSSNDATAYLMQQNNDHLHIGTNNTTRLFVKNDGTIGIGTTSPVYELSIYDPSGSATIHLANGTVGSTSEDGARFTASTSGILYLENLENAPTVFTTNNTERVRITSDGKLGVGTSSPSVTLEVAGSDGIKSLRYQDGTWPSDLSSNLQAGSLLQRADSGNGGISLYQNGFTTSDINARIKTDGSAYFLSTVGIGTASPSGKLDIVTGTTGNVLIDAEAGSNFHAKIVNDSGDLHVGTRSTSADTFLVSNRRIYLRTGSSESNALYINESGLVGIGDTNPDRKLQIINSSDALMRLGRSDASSHGSTDVEIKFSKNYYSNAVFEAASHRFEIQGTEKVRIDGSGRLLVGTSSARSDFAHTTAPQLQVEGTNFPSSAISITRNSADNGGSVLQFAKTRASAVGGNGVVANNDVLGYIFFDGNDGADFSRGAAITAEVDGTPGINDMPCRLVFGTAADGASVPTERMRIDSSGRLGLGTTSPSSLLHLSVASAASDGTKGVRITNPAGTTAIFECGVSNDSYVGTTSGSNFSIRTNNTARICVLNGGNVGIGTTSPVGGLDVRGSVFSLATNNATTRGYYAGPSDYATSTKYLFTGWDHLLTAGLIYTQGAYPINFYTNNQERVRIDGSGRLLVGASSAPTGPNTQYSKLGIFGNSSGATTGLFSVSYGAAATGLTSAFNIGRILFGDTGAAEFGYISCEVDGTSGSGDYPGRLVFATTADGASSPTERMRIAANGYVHFGPYAPSPGNAETVRIQTKNATNRALVLRTNNASSTSYSMAQFLDGDSNSCGEIIINASANTTNYSTSSDYRLKENIASISSPVERLNQLNPCSFNFISSPDTRFDGFLAHEAQAVVPEAVNGTKDEVDEDGNPVLQGIDQSKLVPLLTAALQEALAEIESLKARVTALEP